MGSTSMLKKVDKIRSLCHRFVCRRRSKERRQRPRYDVDIEDELDSDLQEDTNRVSKKVSYSGESLQ